MIELVTRFRSGGGPLTYESDVRVPPPQMKGSFSDKLHQKRGSFSDKAHKNRGLSVKMHQKIGAFRDKMVKKFLNISSNLLKFSKNLTFCRKLSLV